MANVNVKTVSPTNQVVNVAGGIGYSLPAKEELVSILLTSLAEDKYYEATDTRNARLAQAMKQVDPVFAAKASVYARDIFGMRSITHLAAVALADARFPQKRTFYKKVVVRPDDALSILAAYGPGEKPLPNAMKRGLADAIGGFKANTLAKYKSLGREVNMYDAINLVHPKSAAVDAFMKGEVRVADTWEVELSTTTNKTESWRKLVLENKLGIMALLRNLRNILAECKNDTEVMEAVYAQLTDEQAVLRSRLFPYRFLAAYYTFMPAPTSYGYSYRYDREVKTDAPQKLLSAINAAAEISLKGVPTLSGSSALILDVSASMESAMSQKSKMRMIDAGAMLGAMLYKKNPDSELVQYADKGRKLRVNADMPLLEIAKIFATNPGIGHGTNLTAGIKALTGKHDRLIVVSDMQTWMDHYYGGGQTAWKEYNKRMGTDSFGYEIDLGGYGTTAFNNRSDREFHLPTITDKIFMVMGALETGGASLIGEIEKVTL